MLAVLRNERESLKREKIRLQGLVEKVMRQHKKEQSNTAELQKELRDTKRNLDSKRLLIEEQQRKIWRLEDKAREGQACWRRRSIKRQRCL